MSETLLHVKKEKEVFELAAKEKPVPSFLRGFSAPVKLNYEYSRSELMLLLAKDSDPFARWEAGQTLSLQILQDLISRHAAGKELKADEEYIEVLGKLAADESVDPAFRSQVLRLPDEGYLGQQQATILVDSVHAARAFLLRAIALHNEDRFRKLYAAHASDGAYRYDSRDVGRRSLKATALAYLTRTGKAEYAQEALQLLKRANNMTDETAALDALVHHESAEREEGLHHFYQKWNKESLVMNKWLGRQGASAVPGALERVKRIMKDPVFNINNPNKVASLIGSFGRMNTVQFQAIYGAAYRFFADLVIDIDTRNPSLSARLVSFFNQWKRYDPKRQALMKAELERIVAKPGLSPGVFEIASKALG
jgi:aminopeptidase N